MIIFAARGSDYLEPQINKDERRSNALSEKIIVAAFEVGDVPGAGFLENVQKPIYLLFVDPMQQICVYLRSSVVKFFLKKLGV